MLLILWCRYALKVIAVGVYSCYIVCMIIAVWLLDPCQLSDICFPVFATCVNMFFSLVSFDLPLYEHADACRIHKHETLLVCLHQTQYSAGFFPWKWGTFVAIFSQQKLGENSVLCVITHQRQNVARFSLCKFGNNSKCASEALIKITPLPKSNLKAQFF